jgi:hypothetical protein
MNQEWNAEDLGQEIGYAGTEHLLATAEKICAHEEHRIELVNQARGCALEKQYQDLMEVDKELRNRLRHAPPSGDLRSRRRGALFHWAVAGILAMAGFIFTVLTFDPYRFGWKSYVFCVGIAVVTPFLVEKVITLWDSAWLVKSLATIGCCAALVSLVLLAEIRGDLLTEEIKMASTEMTVDSAGPAHPEDFTFYDRTLALLRVAMGSLAVAMELGAGLALREARQLASDSAEDPESLREELTKVEQGMAGLIIEIVTLRNEPHVFAEKFWRNFYSVMLTHATQNAAKKLFLGTLLVLAFLPFNTRAQERPLSLVVAVDLTQSVAARDGNEESEFTKNLDAVKGLLANLPRGARVTVLGITDQSFSQPTILLSGHVPTDPGYFGEHLRHARYLLVHSWEARCSQLKPHFRETDIIGALLIAEQSFDPKDNGSDKVLVLLSDMRHHTADLNLESKLLAPEFSRMEAKSDLIPDLKNVKVYILGVDGAGKPITYWKSLRAFWLAYFQTTGATVMNYSVLREGPIFGETHALVSSGTQASR